MAVSNFIYKINKNPEIFSLLSNMACTRNEGGESSCYTAIQEAVGYCYQMVENCLGRVPCDCVLDFIALVEVLQKADNIAVMEAYTKLDDSVIGIIKEAEPKCR